MSTKIVQMKYLLENLINTSSTTSSTSSFSTFSNSLLKKKNQIIPNEILFRIFSYCDIDTLFHSIIYVSKQWNSLLKRMSFAGQINLKIYDDKQFKKLYSNMKSSYPYRDNPYALPNSSFGYTGYSSYGSYGSFGDYQNYSSYSNYNSYGNYGGYGSYNGYNDYDDYINYENQYQHQKLKEKGKLNESLEPNYHIKLLDSKKSNPDFSMPVVFQIDLALPLSFIIANEKEDISNNENHYQLTSILNNYNIINHDLSLSSTSSSSYFFPHNPVETNDNETKNVIPNFDLESFQGYLIDKKKEINQFKAFFFINGIEISIDTDKVITPLDTNPNQDVNNNDITATTTITTTNYTIITNGNNSNSNNNQSTTYNQNQELIESRISNNLSNYQFQIH